MATEMKEIADQLIAYGVAPLAAIVKAYEEVNRRQQVENFRQCRLMMEAEIKRMEEVHGA